MAAPHEHFMGIGRNSSLLTFISYVLRSCDRFNKFLVFKFVADPAGSLLIIQHFLNAADR